MDALVQQALVEFGSIDAAISTLGPIFIAILAGFALWKLARALFL